MDQSKIMKSKVMIRQLLNLRKKLKEQPLTGATVMIRADEMGPLADQEVQFKAILAAEGYKTDNQSLQSYLKDPMTLGKAGVSAYNLPHQRGFKR
ncbi:MAG: hypothetical protein ACI9O0_000529 [Paracoccaceae bacterium]|jgi:hypothetical protein